MLKFKEITREGENYKKEPVENCCERRVSLG
jgi:hypothetical protein